MIAKRAGFYLELLDLLKQDPKNRFYAENGKDLLRNKLYECAMKMDKDLIKLLLSNERIKNKFFTDVDGLLVFDKTAFGWAINNKAFLNDSYTRFKNTIGLINSSEQFISSKNDVVLSFPYKDCVLAGGQTREDQKRDEIYYNELLAPDDVDRLLAPKVFTNAKRYTKDGEEVITSFNDNDNLLIKGNNLLALSSILKRYEGKVKCIYIDPPYNTNSNANTFCYNNTFNESTWLTFMQNRFKLAKRLLSKDGSLIVAIDENEHCELGVLLKEIFKDSHDIHCITIVHNPRGIQGTNFSYTNEFAFFIIPKNKKVILDRKINSDEIEWSNLRNWGAESERTDAKNCFYSINVDINSGNIVDFDDVCDDSYHPTKNIFKDNIVKIYPIDSKNIERKWRYARQSIQSIKHLLRARIKNGSWDVEIGKDFGQYKTVWIDPKYDANEYGTKIVNSLVPNNTFDFPKSLWNVYDCLYSIVGNDKNAIILDFFGGSGTTAHAVMELNKNDNGFRKFIITEQMYYIESVTKERIKAVANECNTNFVYCELKELNQKYIDEIMPADDNKLVELYSHITESEFINYKVDINKLKEGIEDFKQLETEEKRHFLIEVLDKNLLYVNYSDIEDENFCISEEEKNFTKSFYGAV